MQCVFLDAFLYTNKTDKLLFILHNITSGKPLVARIESYHARRRIGIKESH